MKLHGIFPPLTTPFTSEGALALDRLRENIGKYNHTHLAGYVVTGSTGESVLLSRKETEQVWAAARAAASSEKILIAGTGVESTAETIERTNCAAALGYHAALVYRAGLDAEVDGADQRRHQEDRGQVDEGFERDASEGVEGGAKGGHSGDLLCLNFG